MLSAKNTPKLLFIFSLLTLSFFYQPRQAYAWWGEHHHNDRSYGRVLIALPHGSVRVVFGRDRYYYCDGFYYRQYAQRYIVVPPPEEAMVTANITPEKAQDEFTVNIPNSQGGYTAVKIKRSGNGFTGPQGEFYAEFPKVEQLRAMYVK